ncbi:MAG: hypothetical protein F2667_12555 [Actinobacteria bacterium]|uniref:Unannotated protein n=1 Tax=freshwater metagenome TaxID=449393 RepID=A0A6J6RZU2_9ZZZZ|nr:hypothetical protein [Actinomycetota bacterium]
MSTLAAVEAEIRTMRQAISNAGTALANLRATCAQMTPREQAEAAWSPSSRFTVDQLEDRIRIRRGMDPIHGFDRSDLGVIW